MDLTAAPVALLLAARTVPETAADALEHLRALIARHATAASPRALAEATGIPERTLRRVLAELDAAGGAPALGYVRARGGGAREALKARKTRASAKIVRQSTESR